MGERKWHAGCGIVWGYDCYLKRDTVCRALCRVPPWLPLILIRSIG